MTCDLQEHRCETPRPPASGAHCHTDSECHSDQLCDRENHKCIYKISLKGSDEHCHLDSECPPGMTCDPQEHHCQTIRPPLTGAHCHNDSECR
ncbi:MAG: hypothetical protein GY696_13185, partial [Gammaproteobacteria bacterium]|nr:hypothetical protein [Gammaproteobacteria bacterium]